MDDELVRVKPMLDRINGWSTYLPGTDESNYEDLIGLHIRTGRPLGSNDFVRKLEVITGKELIAKRPGRKPFIVK